MLLLRSVNERKVNMKRIWTWTRGAVKGGGGFSSTMTDYCAQVSLQTKPN